MAEKLDIAQFTAEVVEISSATKIAEQSGAKAQSWFYEVVDLDPRWIMKLKIIKVAPNNTFDPQPLYGIHSPVRLFGKATSEVIGHIFKFKVSRGHTPLRSVLEIIPDPNETNQTHF